MLRPGAHVRIHGLNKNIHLNETEASLIRWSEEDGRWATRSAATGECVLIKEANLQLDSDLSVLMTDTIDDMLLPTCGHLDPVSVLACAAASKTWAAVAFSDAVWNEHCETLWQGKLHIEQWRQPDIPRRTAYFQSLRDSTRTCLTAEELCSFEWSARVKSTSGMTHECPWWNGQPPGYRRYKRIVDAEPPTDDPADSEAGEPAQRARGTYVSSERGPGRWELDCASDPTTVACSRDGRQFLSHRASRWPVNWGWLLQNPYGFSASFPLPPEGVEPSLEDGGEFDCNRATRSAGPARRRVPDPVD